MSGHGDSSTITYSMWDKPVDFCSVKVYTCIEYMVCEAVVVKANFLIKPTLHYINIGKTN